ncbi:MAG: hypothetical protein WBA29_01865 [Xanthobacteraceae bacterium]
MPKRMRPFTTRPLVLWVIFISVVVTAITELRIAGHGGVMRSAIVAYAAFFTNIAISAIGFRTPERIWWIANIALSILTMTFIGSPTLPSAAWTVGRVLLSRLYA